MFQKEKAIKDCSYQLNLVFEDIEKQYIEAEREVSWREDKIKNLEKENEELKDKVLKGFTYNKVVRRKTKAISKYLNKININNLSENEAKELLKQLKIKLDTVAYSYNKEVFY